MSGTGAGTASRAAAGLLARAGSLGAAVGAAGLVVLVAAGRPPAAASTLTFSVGALAFGFGLTAWAVSVLLGNSLAVARPHLGTRDWSGADTRQAMAVVAALGAGAMLGSVAATVGVRALVG